MDLKSILAIIVAFFTGKSDQEKAEVAKQIQDTLQEQLKPQPPKVVPQPPVTPEPKPEPPKAPTGQISGLTTNPNRLNSNKEAAKKGDKLMQKAINNVIKLGQDWLNQKVSYVTEKTKLIPGVKDSLHYFMSMAPYWHLIKGEWVRKDAQANGISEAIGDVTRLQKQLMPAVENLSKAYVATDDQNLKDKFAKRVIDICTSFFLDSKTGMMPSFIYANAVPGQVRVESAVEGRPFIIVANWLLFLQDSKFYTEAFRKGMQKWFADLAYWLEFSATGKKANEETVGNIASIYEAQLVAFNAFGGNMDYAAKRRAKAIARLFHDIAPDGGLPEEKKRVKAFMYHCKAIDAIYLCARIYNSLGQGIWYEERSGKMPLLEVIRYMLPYFMGKKRFNNSEKITYSYFVQPLRTALLVYEKYLTQQEKKDINTILEKNDPIRDGAPDLFDEPFLDWR
ncbi:alginate lyase family protein [Adhaeribacter swui]|uniref:Alginate lyase family protein n=1 Tax=Adhaeribacter swui TaxID=2086471 RepID=A0A7G7GB39_9BACT|nr:alginate lyase family protein [Adhaeribacter swui]QNF34373.1 alginate lyase family protein [Adhaeribacter swui]